MSMEQIAENYWGGLGVAAIHGLSRTDVDSDFGETTAAGLRDETASLIFRPAERVKANYVLDAYARDITHTVDIGTHKTRPNRPQAPLERVTSLFTQIMHDEAGDGITMRMRVDALRFLSKIPPTIPMPAVEFGTEEITFEWRHEDLEVAASVDGDGLVGYALKRDGRFVPGEGPENLSVEGLPADLLAYLRNLPID